MDLLTLFEHFLQDKEIQYQKLDNLIMFSYKDLHFALLYDPQDLNYYRLILPIKEEGFETNQRNKLLIELISEIKVAKVIETDSGNIWFSYEQLLSCENVSDCEYVFARSMRILTEMLNRYRTKINQLKPIEKENNQNG